ncbi:AraC family transcriptional regulator [Marinobacterium nitratireducens]|nr:AraC family transcriptional regulator [Marinobacterium nitratireducens]
MDTPTSIDNARFRHLPDFGGLDLLHYRYNGAVYSRHVHEGYAIHVIDSGAERFHCMGASHVAGPDDIVLVNPDTVHDGQEADAGCRYRGFYPSPELMISLAQSFEGSGLPWFASPVIRDVPLAQRLRQLIEVLERSDNRLLCDSAWLGVMGELNRRHGRQRLTSAPPGNERDAVRRVREYLDAYSHENPSLADLAALCGLSPHYLNRLFQRDVGLPPHAYLVQRRLIQARRLLRAGLAPADAALTAGFSDQSHLNRHFKRALGITPGQYRNGILRG